MDLRSKVSQEIRNGVKSLSPSEDVIFDALVQKLDITALPSNLTLYPTNVASDIGGYLKMVISIDDLDYNEPAINFATPAITGVGQLVGSLATTSGVLTGDPGELPNVTTIGNIRRVSGSGTANFYFEAYHRDLAGTETLIGTSGNTLTVSSAVYEEFFASIVWDNGVFLSSDRIVIKYYANRSGGGSDPVFNFQFGGSSPTRTVVPAPLTSIPLTVADTGTVIDFTFPKIFNLPSAPATGNITEDLTNARIGITQEIYHNDSVEPTFPAGWVIKGTGTYVINVDNIIYAKWIEGSVVHYWIIQ